MIKLKKKEIFHNEIVNIYIFFWVSGHCSPPVALEFISCHPHSVVVLCKILKKQTVALNPKNLLSIVFLRI